MIIEPTGSNSTVTGAIRQAARMTGADFRYLLATAQVESNLNPGAQAPSSSAKGLFQFIDQTWLATLKEQGPALGYAPYSNAIGRTPTGEYAIANPRMADAVMNLRNDPAANALMAGAFTKANAGKLAARLGRSATEGELYIAHFLGPTGAGKLISMADATPQTPAAAVFPGPAYANRRIFFDGRGQPRSVSEVYRMLVGRYEVARGGPPSTPTMAAATASPEGESRKAVEPDTALTTDAYANATRMSPSGRGDGTGAVFHGLFRTAGESEPVAPVVSALWGTQAPPSSPQKPQPLPEPPPASAAPLPEAASGPLDLFQDTLPNVSALFRGRV